VRGGKGCGRKGPIASGMNALASGMDTLVGPMSRVHRSSLLVICLLSQGLLLLLRSSSLCAQSCPHSQHARRHRLADNSLTRAHRLPHTRTQTTLQLAHASLTHLQRTRTRAEGLEPKLATRNHPASSDGKPCSFNRDSIVSNQEAGSRKQEAGSRKDSREARNEKHVTRSTSREARHEKHVKDAPSIPPPHGRQECDEHKAYPHMAPRMR
jgi:hypothetical protein